MQIYNIYMYMYIVHIHDTLNANNQEKTMNGPQK